MQESKRIIDMKDCYKTINLSKLRQNVKVIKKYLKNCKFCAVVKSDAYGHNASIVCRAICNYVDYLAVSSNDEAVAVRKLCPVTPCLILQPVSRYNLSDAIECGATFSVQSKNDLQILNREAKKLNKIAYYHLQINSGMNRFGITRKDDICFLRNKYTNTKLAGIYSHFGAGFCPEEERSKQQIIRFNELSKEFPDTIIRHFCNTQNIFSHPNEHYDMVRSGIGIYGYGNEFLQPIMQVYAKIVSIQNVSKGEYIGYGLDCVATSDMKIATLAIGYADGLPRLWAKDGFVLLNGKKAKIIGNICMEATFVDISQIPVKLGDYATILSDIPTLNAETIANSCKTIPYEILTNFRNIPTK